MFFCSLSSWFGLFIVLVYTDQRCTAGISIRYGYGEANRWAIRNGNGAVVERSTRNIVIAYGKHLYSRASRRNWFVFSTLFRITMKIHIFTERFANHNSYLQFLFCFFCITKSMESFWHSIWGAQTFAWFCWIWIMVKPNRKS